MSRVHRVAAVALTLLAAACSDAPVAPQTRPQSSAAAGEHSSPLARYRNGPPQITIGFAMKPIGPEGGTISLAGFEVVVPPGAVSKWTNFTIRLPVDPSMSDYVWASFGPHGMQFNTPVTLKLPYTGTTSEGNSTTHVMWFNGASWVELPTTFTTDGRIQTQTSHFSVDALFDQGVAEGVAVVV